MTSRLQHSAADVIRYLMVAQGLGVLPSAGGSWPIYVGTEPETPDNCLTVYNTTPVKDGRYMVSGQVAQHYGVLVRVRGVNQQTIAAKAEEVKAVLTEQVQLATVDVGPSLYLVQSLSLASGPIYIGAEPEGERELATVNFLAPVKQLS